MLAGGDVAVKDSSRISYLFLDGWLVSVGLPCLHHLLEYLLSVTEVSIGFYNSILENSHWRAVFSGFIIVSGQESLVAGTSSLKASTLKTISIQIH